MSLIFQNGSRTQSYGPGEKMPALPPQPGFGKPKTSQPAGGTQYAGGDANWRNVGKPGQAQSTPAPSQGTKYGAYSPRPPSSQTTGDPRGMLANAPPSQRPPPIQMGVAQTPWGQSMDPFAERDAFARQIGQQRINNQIAFNTSGPNAPQGSPFINYDMARQNAGLAGGAPSMNANPADTFIGKFNNQFGAPNPTPGGGQPPAYISMRGDPKMNPNRPPPEMLADFLAGGEQIAFYPKTGWGPLDSGSKATSTVDFGPGPAPPQSSRPGNAQPIAQPPRGTPYSPAGGSRPAPGNEGVYESNGNTYFPANGGVAPPAPSGFEWVKSARNRESPLVLQPIDPATQPAQPIAPQQPGSYYPGFDPRTQDPYGQPRHSRKNPDVDPVLLPPDHPLRRPGSVRPMPRGFDEVERPPVYMGGQRLVRDPTNGLRPRERGSYGISRRR